MSRDRGIRQGESFQPSTHRRMSVDGFHVVWWVGALGVAAVGIGAAALAVPNPAQAQDFCSQTGEGGEGEPCPGPIVGPDSDISGSTQRQIQPRLQFLRCEDPACGAQGGASQDSVSYEGLGVFVAADYQHKDRKTTTFEMGYESDSFGPTVGVDYRIGTDGVIGSAFDFSHTVGDLDDDFGDFTTDTFSLIFYGSYYPTDQSFVDAAVGFGHKQYDVDHDDLPGGGPSIVSGNTTGFEFTADLTGGYDFTFGSVSVGPRIGVHYKRAALNSFTETGAGAGTLLSYKDQVEDSLSGTVGVQASMAFSTGFGVVVPQVNAEYVREFLDDRETYTAAFVGGGGSFNFVTDQPDRNHFNLGAGVVVLLPDGVSPFINYETEVANYLEETHTLTGGVRLEF